MVATMLVERISTEHTHRPWDVPARAETALSLAGMGENLVPEKKPALSDRPGRFLVDAREQSGLSDLRLSLTPGRRGTASA
jgi:hypothetical protein